MKYIRHREKTLEKDSKDKEIEEPNNRNRVQYKE